MRLLLFGWKWFEESEGLKSFCGYNIYLLDPLNIVIGREEARRPKQSVRVGRR
jgi:hypothetical protein